MVLSCYTVKSINEGATDRPKKDGGRTLHLRAHSTPALLCKDVSPAQ